MHRTFWFLVRQVDGFVYDPVDRPLAVGMLIILRKLKGFLDMLSKYFRLMNRLPIVLSNPFGRPVGSKNDERCFIEPRFGNGRREVINSRAGCTQKNNGRFF